MARKNLNKLGVTLIAAVAVYAVFSLYQQKREGEVAQTRTRLEQQLVATPNAALFALLKTRFPDAYQTFLDDVAADAGPNAFHDINDLDEARMYGSAFFYQTRLDNADYMRTAPLESLRAVLQSSLDIMNRLVQTPELCAQYVMRGGNAFSIEDAELVGLGYLVNGGLTAFRAIADGRDHPVEHPAAQPDDQANFMAAWRARDGVSASMAAALSREGGGGIAHPDFCAASISFQEFLINGRSQLVERTLVDLTTRTAGN